MEKMKRRGVFLAVALFATPLTLGNTTEGSEEEKYRIDEPTLRSRVVSTVHPVIPPDYQPRTPARAVAEIEVSANGSLLAIEILEAPSVNLARAVQSALKSWKFRSFGAAHVRYLGKLTFYFVSVDGVTRALSPEEMARMRRH
jgi:hypothetical protein